MKKLKAVAAVLCAGAVTAGIFAFSGCKTTTSGVINGNYKEATATEFTAAVETIDTENLFTPAEDANKFGYEFYTTLGGKASYNGGKLGDAFEISAKADAEMKFILSKTDNKDVDLTGAGKLNYELLSNISKLGNNKLSAGFYADNSNLYFDAKMITNIASSEQTSSLKYKIPYETIEEMLKGFIGGINPAAEGSASINLNFAQIIKIAAQFGFKTYIDYDNGLKLKLTADKQTVMALLASVDSEFASKIAFGDGFKLEIYFAIDRAGKFAGFAVNYNITATVTVGNSDFVMISTTNATTLKVYTGAIKLPANFDNYDEIPDFGGSNVYPYIAY